jgi:hypothetical protein
MKGANAYQNNGGRAALLDQLAICYLISDTLAAVVVMSLPASQSICGRLVGRIRVR